MVELVNRAKDASSTITFHILPRQLGRPPFPTVAAAAPGAGAGGAASSAAAGGGASPALRVLPDPITHRVGSPDGEHRSGALGREPPILYTLCFEDEAGRWSLNLRYSR